MRRSSQKNKQLTGHLLAVFTIIVWGTTFISTKLLLVYFTPIQLLFLRFFLGYIFLWLIRPKVLRLSNKKEEAFYILAGFLGITMYYLLENIALTYTNASNVGVAVSLAPFFTVLVSEWLFKEGQVNRYFFFGFVVALSGIGLISFNGVSALEINPLGDFLGIGAAFVWALYSFATKKIRSFGHPVLLTTRRTFFYGLLFMLPIVFLSGSPFPSAIDWNSYVIGNILFLGIGASAICFVTWNYSVGLLGAVKTSVYIYAVPAITVVTAAVFLDEPFTLATAAGTILTTVGLFLSEKSSKQEIGKRQAIQKDIEAVSQTGE